MKKLLTTILFGVLLTLPLFGQATNTKDGPQPPLSGDHGPMDNLPQPEREKLKAAHDLALQKDPSLDDKIKAAHEATEEARKELYNAMITVDPSVEPILNKIIMSKHGSMPPKFAKELRKAPNSQQGNLPGTNPTPAAIPPQERHGQPPGFANLSSTEQVRLKSLHDQVKNDPTVIASHDDEKNAATPEEHRAAKESVRKAIQDAMLKADPSIEPILLKLHPEDQPQDSQSPKQ